MFKHKQLRLQEACISNLGFLLLQHIKRLVSFHITCYRVSPHDDFIMATYSDNFFVSASFVVIFLSLSLTMKCKVINHDGLKCVFTDCPDGTFGPNCTHTCSYPTYGRRCILECKCTDNQKCDPAEGCINKINGNTFSILFYMLHN